MMRGRDVKAVELVAEALLDGQLDGIEQIEMRVEQAAQTRPFKLEIADATGRHHCGRRRFPGRDAAFAYQRIRPDLGNPLAVDNYFCGATTQKIQAWRRPAL